MASGIRVSFWFAQGRKTEACEPQADIRCRRQGLAVRAKLTASAPWAVRISRLSPSIRIVATDSSALKNACSCAMTPGAGHMRRVVAAGVKARLLPAIFHVEVKLLQPPEP